MKYPLMGKGLVLGLLSGICALSASAQTINEKDLKLEVGTISDSKNKLLQLEPVRFTYDLKKFKHLNFPSGEQYGFLANDVKAVFPALVHEKSKQYPAGKNSTKVATYNEVSHQELIPILVAAVKEQQAEIEALKKALNQLKTQAK
ncbi:MAG: tail fiber domain-containing protein [Bacteroidota bacterium]